jgi:UPF0716 protein FxsA
MMLLALPLLEIAAFIVIGGQIGVLATFAIIFLTAVLGAVLMRIQGFGLIERIRHQTRQGGVPGKELVHGVMILLAGILLILPGFITDTLGILLFVPAIREIGWKLVRRRIVVSGAFAGSWQYGRGPADSGSIRTIELDEGEYDSPRRPETPWRRP